jgi:hypothetical protein
MDALASWIPTIFRASVLFVIPLTFLLLKGRKMLDFYSKMEKIPGPKTWPLIGNAQMMLNKDLRGKYCNGRYFTVL